VESEITISPPPIQSSTGAFLQLPSFIINIGKISNLFESIFVMIDLAESREISCSTDLPPKTIPTTFLDKIIPLCEFLMSYLNELLMSRKFGIIY
jgi:hypothetical protein